MRHIEIALDRRIKDEAYYDQELLHHETAHIFDNIITTKRKAGAAVKKLGRLSKRFLDVKERADQKIQRIQATLQAAQTKMLEDEIVPLLTSLYNFCIPYETQSKRLRLYFGEVEWRDCGPSVLVMDKVKDVIRRLKRRGLTIGIRYVPELNKRNISAKPAKFKGIKGLSVCNRILFKVKPYKAKGIIDLDIDTFAIDITRSKLKKNALKK